MEFIHFFFKDYSKHDLTKKTNKAITISGLEACIVYILSTKKANRAVAISGLEVNKYSIFEWYLYRNLLWQVFNNKMEWIIYKNWNVLLWLCMVYNKGIQFIDIPFSIVNWINKFLV